jgi:hypothetical protein
VTNEGWKADSTASFARRLGKSPQELGNSSNQVTCPDMWLLDNDDVAVIGHDLTDVYRERLPEGVALSPGERLVVIPGNILGSAKQDIPDA